MTTEDTTTTVYDIDAPVLSGAWEGESFEMALAEAYEEHGAMMGSGDPVAWRPRTVAGTATLTVNADGTHTISAPCPEGCWPSTSNDDEPEPVDLILGRNLPTVAGLAEGIHDTMDEGDEPVTEDVTFWRPGEAEGARLMLVPIGVMEALKETSPSLVARADDGSASPAGAGGRVETINPETGEIKEAVA